MFIRILNDIRPTLSRQDRIYIASMIFATCNDTRFIVYGVHYM